MKNSRLRQRQKAAPGYAKLCSSSIKKMNFVDTAQMRRGALRGNIPLRTAEHFVSNHELLHGGGAQKRRKIVRVKMPLRMGLAIRRLLVESHRIRKRSGEQIVVADGQTPHDGREIVALRIVKIERSSPRAGGSESSSRTATPPSTEPAPQNFHSPTTMRSRSFCSIIKYEQSRHFSCFSRYSRLRRKFARRLIRNRLVRPDLAMRMRIARPHQRAAIFENLNVLDPVDLTKFAILLGPNIDDRAHFFGLHARNGQVVPRRKTNHATHTTLAASNDQAFLIDLEWPARRATTPDSRC